MKGFPEDVTFELSLGLTTQKGLRREEEATCKETKQPKGAEGCGGTKS